MTEQSQPEPIVVIAPPVTLHAVAGTTPPENEDN